MNEIPFNMKTGWWSFGILQSLPTEWWQSNRSRFLPSTYELVPYELLPPIKIPLNDNFEWLESQPVKKNGLESQGDPLSGLLEISRQAGIALPSALTTFLKNTELHRRIRSNTGCCLLASSFTQTNDGYLIPFLSDSQGCVYWHIHLNNRNQYFITASTNEYGFTDGTGKPFYREPIDLKEAEIWYCGPTISEFMYRFWIENEIWFALEGKQSLTSTEQVYFDGFLNAMK